MTPFASISPTSCGAAPTPSDSQIRLLSTNGSRLWCSHRVVELEDDPVTDTGVRTNGDPLGAAPLSPLPHRRSPRAAPLSPHCDRQVHASAHHGAISAHDGPKVTATGRRSFAIHTCSISCLMIIIASAACPSCT